METFEPGDKVKITSFYLANYPTWGLTVKDVEATVVSARSFKVQAVDLGKDDRPLYQGVYGIQKEYTLFELMINLNGAIYLVSQLGFNK